MSIAIHQSEIGKSPTVQQFQWTCGCVGLAIGVGCALYAVETLLLGCERRFVENPTEVMMRAVGIAHFSIGWLFLFSSPRLRNRVALSRLFFFTVFGAAFCAVFAWGGADKNPLPLMAFYSFFFIHEALDEAYLFRTSGEAPAPSPAGERFLRALGFSVALTFMTLLATSQIAREQIFARSGIAHYLPMHWFIAAWAALVAVTLLAYHRTVVLARLCCGSLAEAGACYRPLLTVYAALIGILLVGSLFGSIGTNLVILIHALTWFVCMLRRLSDNPVQATGPWSWLRQTPAGFLTLHLAVTSIALLLFALRTHVWERTGIVCDLVSKTWFPYWAIMHISMSFWRTK
ncbi:MAG: hypothetical protein HYX68_20470 [Planctomycetes bacterium]|nr:hypothetical protein [Planctomycetota bacterium]